MRAVNVRTTVVGPRPEPTWDGAAPIQTGESGRVGSRQAWFTGKFHECPVYRRELIPAGLVIPGPAIVEQGDTTVVIEPGFEAGAERLGHLLIRRP